MRIEEILGSEYLAEIAAQPVARTYEAGTQLSPRELFSLLATDRDREFSVPEVRGIFLRALASEVERLQGERRPALVETTAARVMTRYPMLRQLAKTEPLEARARAVNVAEAILDELATSPVQSPSSTPREQPLSEETVTRLLCQYYQAKRKSPQVTDAQIDAYRTAHPLKIIAVSEGAGGSTLYEVLQER